MGWGPNQPHSDGRTPVLLILFGCGFAALGNGSGSSGLSWNPGGRGRLSRVRSETEEELVLFQVTVEESADGEVEAEPADHVPERGIVGSVWLHGAGDH